MKELGHLSPVFMICTLFFTILPSKTPKNPMKTRKSNIMLNFPFFVFSSLHFVSAAAYKFHALANALKLRS